MTMTTEEAESFMTNVLKFENWNEVLQRDKLEFLRAVVIHYGHHTYFQNISMASTPPDQRHVPDDKEIVRLGLVGTGGPCLVQNGFLALLLKALGLNIFIVSGMVKGPGNTPDNHVICIVEISPEEKYLLDLGVALPFAEPIAMHNLPYENVSGGLRYRYKLSDDPDLYVRVQLDGGMYGSVYEDKSLEFVRYDFTMAPQPLNFFLTTLIKIFTVTDESVFLKGPFLFRYFEEDEAGNVLDEPKLTANRKWILIRGVSVLISDDTKSNVTHYSTYDEVKTAIFKYFPKLRQEDVEKAVGYFNETVDKFGYSSAKKE